MNVNVVMGGPSAEYDVSILTGTEMIRHLMGGPHHMRAVVIDSQRSFYRADITAVAPSPQALSDPASQAMFEGPFRPAASQRVWEDCDVALLAVHGSFGEDGRLQGFLETIGVPYTGSGVEASSVSMNKIATKHLLERNDIATPPYCVYGPHHSTTQESIARQQGFPCYVKCPQSGSSKLMGRADSAAELAALLAELSQHADDLLVERAVDGFELSCPVLTLPGGSARALPPVEIRPVSSTFFDYTAKYTAGACEEIVPMQRPEPLLEEIRQTALRVHQLLGCDGITRTDMIATPTALYVLEINTLPGFTPASLVPKSYAAEGGTYAGLLELLMDMAVRRHREQKS
jgi:D-alanine-D-alanine ligase